AVPGEEVPDGVPARHVGGERPDADGEERRRGERPPGRPGGGGTVGHGRDDSGAAIRRYQRNACLSACSPQACAKASNGATTASPANSGAPRRSRRPSAAKAARNATASEG